MRKLLFTLFILGNLIAGSLQAQNTGFAGKRVLLKTNLINGLYGFCNSYSAEIAVHRKMTVSVGYDAINTSVRQSYNPLETVGTAVSINSKAQTSYKGINFEFRKYFSREKPAPYGFFMSFNYANGNLDIEKANYPEKLFIVDGKQDIYYRTNGISLHKINIGAGYQKALNKWLFIGGQLSIGYNVYGNLIEGLPQNAASGVLKNYGSNIFSMNYFNEEKPVQEQQTKSFGISGNIQLGIMLF